LRLGDAYGVMELLAPAGDAASLRAAVCAGADAVYLGYARFGARASAANFDAEALEKAVAYAHLYHVRVHVTLNTLIKPNETDAIRDALATVSACGADAVIVQDLGVARLARELFPTLELHASTQMAIHTAAGVRFAIEHGFRRVVLARECPLAVIAQAATVGADIEVFVHGALCAGVSGQCLLSSMAGGRSGNRGRCAQPCRQPVTLGANTAALLSMRDLCLRDDLPLLQAAGVKALKIEGRLKRPEYVAVVTNRYRKALDALARGTFAPADEAENTALKQAFHRGGFTVGHALGAQDAALCSTERVGHGGVAVGAIDSVKNGLAVARLNATLHDGDGLLIAGTPDEELRYSGPEQSERAVIRLRPGARACVGDALLRLTDVTQQRWAENLTEPPLPVTLRFWARVGEPMRLWASDGESAAETEGETAQAPRTRALTPDELANALRKLGDTPFTLGGEPEIDAEPIFAPVSVLNALRRLAIAKLAELRREAFAQKGRVQAPMVAEMQAPGHGVRARGKDAVQTLAVSFFDASLGQDFLNVGANLLLYAPTVFTADALRRELPKLPPGVWLALPPQFSDLAFAALKPTLLENAGMIKGVVLGSVGQLGFSLPLPVALGEGVPVTNGETARELLRDTIAFFTLWPEWNRRELEALLAETNNVPALLKVYGRERLMLLNHCPERVARGLNADRADCALCGPDDRACAAREPVLSDRHGYRFPLRRLMMPEGCVVEVLNALPTDLAKQESLRRALNAGMLLSFTIETPQEQLAITRRFAAAMRAGEAAANSEPATSGHFLRGVE
jgi:U32 family peptidase